MGETLGQMLQRMSEAQRAATRRKCFVSYYGRDRDEVKQFLKDFGDVFIAKEIGVTDADDFIDSLDPEYVMGRIRAEHLEDSTVTLLMLGTCTHSRRYIDWELKASLRRGAYTPNGLVAIKLPSTGRTVHAPDRFMDNWNREDEAKGYAMFRGYPGTKADLRGWIESAYGRRETHAHLINNAQAMFRYNHKCLVHAETH